MLSPSRISGWLAGQAVVPAGVLIHSQEEVAGVILSRPHSQENGHCPPTTRNVLVFLPSLMKHTWAQRLTFPSKFGLPGELSDILKCYFKRYSLMPRSAVADLSTPRAEKSHASYRFSCILSCMKVLLVVF